MNDEIKTINRIYARTDGNGVVTHIFSEIFETPTLEDICIDEQNTERHGANRYQVYDENFILNYKIVNGKLVERDKTKELKAIEFTDHVVSLKSKLYATDYKALKYADGALSEEEYADIKTERQAWRDEINRLEQKL